MIVSNLKVVRETDVPRYCWSRLRRFHNVDFVRDLICELHKSSGSKFRENAKRQAEHIRFSLQQAAEYADAARGVSLATQPVLAYYSAMSLAIAEVLLKQMGTMFLERMRADHSHHGLELKTGQLNRGENRLVAVAEALRAAPAVRASGEGFGTFELWHRSAREMPVVGEERIRRSGGQTSSTALVYGAADMRFGKLAARGLSLLDCLKRLPPMAEVLNDNGVRAPIVRAICSQDVLADGSVEIRLTFQPGPVTEAMQHDIEVRPEDYECVQWQPFDEADLSWGGTLTLRPIRGCSFYLPLPHCCGINTKEMLFWPGKPILNEFGFYYVGLYILGNYCRYFPDKWLRDVERATPLALAAEQMLNAGRQRVPLLALSEMSRAYHVLEQ